MSIADTIQSIKNHTKEAYDTAEAKGADLPEEKNLANLSDTIAQLDKIDIVQETGDSETAVMSQKATTDAINGIEVPTVPRYILGADNEYELIARSTSADDFGIGFRYLDAQTGDFQYNYFWCVGATDATAGIMTAADKSKLDSLLEIESLNDSLELDENGQLSVVGGGGSDVNLLNSYTATVRDNDVYDASYVNKRLDNGSIALGANAHYSNDNGGAIAIGKNAYAKCRTGAYNNSGIAIGDNAVAGITTATSNAVALGRDAQANSNSGIAIGYFAKTSSGGVALGYGASSSRDGEVSIGNGNDSVYGPNTRYLANVTAGELDTDAVNFKQMKDYVAENAGGSDYQLPAYVVGNTTELDPIAYTVTENTVTANVARTDTATGTALNPALVTFPMATITHAGAISSTDKATLDNLPNNYYSKTEIDSMIGDINEAIVKLDTGTGV